MPRLLKKDDDTVRMIAYILPAALYAGARFSGAIVLVPLGAASKCLWEFQFPSKLSVVS
jgi:hypothetical protein